MAALILATSGGAISNPTLQTLFLCSIVALAVCKGQDGYVLYLVVGSNSLPTPSNGLCVYTYRDITT